MRKAPPISTISPRETITSRPAATVFSAMLAFQLPGKPVLGWLADRIGIRLTMTIDVALIAVGCVLLLGARYTLPLGSFVVLYGLTFGAPVPLVPMLLADAVGLKRFGSLAGLLSIPSVIGSAALLAPARNRPAGAKRRSGTPYLCVISLNSEAFVESSYAYHILLDISY
jgi:MFS family permease